MTTAILYPVQAIRFFIDGAYFSFLFCLFAYFAFFSHRHEKYHTTFAICMFLCSLSVVITLVLNIFSGLPQAQIEKITLIATLFAVPAFWTLVLSIAYLEKPMAFYIRFILYSEIPMLLSLILNLLAVSAPIEWLAISWTIIGSSVIWVFANQQLYKYKKMLMNSYSDVEFRELGWGQSFLHVLPVLLILYLVVGSPWIFSSHTIINCIYYVLAISIFAFLTYRLIRQEPVDISMLKSTEADSETDSKAIEELTEEDEKNTAIALGLKEGFEEKEIYLQPNVTIKDAAQAAQSSIRNVSAYLNEVMGKNFNQYVNDLRIEKAHTMLLEEPYTIDEIAARLGFANRAIFWRVFKVATGTTPNEYITTNLAKGKRMEPSEAKAEEARPEKTTRAEIPSATLVGIVEDFVLQYPRFATTLTQMAPDITTRELQLCMLLALGKENDEICQLMHVGSPSLRVFRSRLRSKLKLGRRASLPVVLMRLVSQAPREQSSEAARGIASAPSLTTK